MPDIHYLLNNHGLELIESNIGSGGSASVHKALVRTQSDRLPPEGSLVAVKQYTPALLQLSGQIERIRQEADIGLRISSPNVVKSYGLLGLDQDGDDTPVLLLLEWIDGKTLEAWYNDLSKPLPWDQIRSICIQILAGLEALHKERIYHRDIKPENVMVQHNGRAVLMDVGVAELTSNSDHTLHTSVKDFIGSVRYASPQFILGDSTFEAGDDIYSLAATLFLLLTGRPVYSEVQRKPVLPIAIVAAPPTVDSVAENVPPALKVLLQGSMNRDIRRRPSLDDFREALTAPDTAPYISRELSAQTLEARSYPIIKVMDRQTNFFADLGGDTPEIDDDYTVVRQSTPLDVPSYARQVTPELWVANAVLRHVHQNVGHFIVLMKSWQQGRSSNSAIEAYAAQGFWVDKDAHSLSVQKGDLVLKAKK